MIEIVSSKTIQKDKEVEPEVNSRQGPEHVENEKTEVTAAEPKKSKMQMFMDFYAPKPAAAEDNKELKKPESQQKESVPPQMNQESVPAEDQQIKEKEKCEVNNLMAEIYETCLEDVAN